MGIRSNTRDIVSGRYRDRTSDLCRVKAAQGVLTTWENVQKCCLNSRFTAH